mmetsp:Transcript_6544/g.13966  ORF Transcript_6544/g.13966 Transcript_6544/m.13966 type:complete len:262 (-) Transcript_6544:41-826(-)
MTAAALGSAARCAVVTGGSSGIGVAIVQKLLQPATPGTGADKVFVTGTRAFESTELCKMLQGLDDSTRSKVKYSIGNCGDSASVAAQAAEATKFFDGAAARFAFLNAGIGGGRQPLEEFCTDRFEAILNTNVKGVFLWLKVLLPDMKQMTVPSQVVVTSSVAGERVYPGAGPYVASKHAVNGLVLSLRQELQVAHRHVRVGLLSPGPVATSWWTDHSRGWRGKDAAAPEMAMLSPEDVATAAINMMNQPSTSNIERVVLDP